MNITETSAKSIIRKHRRIDSWFVSRYGMNLYRGCKHNCVYCDGRSEGYYVEGDFGKDIVVKTNAPELVRKELDPGRRRKPYPGGYIMIGGGVCDSYQPAEEKYMLTRQILEIISNYGFPVHILTKSTLVRRDLDLIRKIHEKAGAIVSFSFSSTDPQITATFEPGVPAPVDRLKTIEIFRTYGIPCGFFLLPVLPYISDSREKLDQSVKDANDAGANFVIFGVLTLKEGRQKDHYYNTLINYKYPLAEYYNQIYKGKKWGETTGNYARDLHSLFYQITQKYGVKSRIPENLFRDILAENDIVTVILEHLDYILKLQGKSSPFGYAAHSISNLKEPLSSYKGNFQSLPGVGRFTEQIIMEILDSGSSSYYRKIM